jgi:acetoin utilization protein AcuB
MSRIPTIKTVMTPFPFSIDADADLGAARRKMEEHGIRHLPVLAEGEPIGMLTHRDLERAETARALAGRDRPRRVRDVCRFPAYAVSLDEPLDNVLVHMASERVGSALVLRADKVVGIFTTTDACRHFAAHLRRDFPPTGDDAA